jgi:hypothetical protein
MLRARDELEHFLRTTTDYPLFGKPTDEQKSLGAASLEGYQSRGDCLLLPGGERLPLTDFVDEVTRHFAAGYLFQRRLTPHPLVRAIAGDRLATVRIMTMCGADGPHILRAAWKIPGGDNIADNFWRPGNLLASLDLATGRVVRVVVGSGLAQRELTHHPDTGARLVGIAVPLWREIIELALEAPKSLRQVPLIGWDMAATERGAVIVEPNYTPDFGLPQLADRRGMLDGPFKGILAACKAESRAAKRQLKRWHAQETRDALSRLGRSITGTGAAD